MMLRVTLFLASLLIMGAVGLLAPSAEQPTPVPEYLVVPGWPQLPGEIKLGQVTAVGTDSADRVYIFHRGKNPVIVLNKDGKYIQNWGEGLVKTAHGLLIDGNDHVWLTDLGSHLVMKFTSAGKLLLTLGQKGKPGTTANQFNKPADVAIGPGGDIFVADGYGNSRVVKFNKEGKYLKEWGKKGKQPGEFNLPHAIQIDKKGRVYVGDRENNRVQLFDLEGKFLSVWKDTGAPFGLYLTRDNRMLLADGRAHLARVLDLEGKTLGRWGEKGAAPGQFTLPHGICMDSRGVVYVTEVNGQRVQKFVVK